MNKDNWEKWMNPYTYELIQRIRSTRFGEITIKIHEKNPVEILKALESCRLGRRQHGNKRTDG